MRTQRGAAQGMIRREGPQSGPVDRQAHYTLSAAPGQPAHGQLVRDFWLREVDGERHQLRRPAAWAMDTTDLDAAEQAGARFVRILDRLSGRSFWASIGTIRARGFPVNRGHGEQLGLELSHWAATRELAEASEDCPLERDPGPRQLCLLGGEL